MRDNRKGQDYYKAYLEYQYSRIEKKSAKLKECDGDKKQRVLISLTGYEVDLLKAEFSAGASKEDIKTLLIRAIDIVSENKKVTYDDLLVLLSLSVMLGLEKHAQKLTKANVEVIKEDRLLSYISSFIDTGKAEWNKNIPLVKECTLMDKVFSGEDKNKAMSAYLKAWYTNHSGYAWYDSHLRDSDTYCGYWSFESAAVSIILGLDDNSLAALENYPKFDK